MFNDHNMIWSNYVFIGGFRKSIKILEKWGGRNSPIFEAKNIRKFLS